MEGPKIGNGPKTVSESTVSNTKLSEKLRGHLTCTNKRAQAAEQKIARNESLLALPAMHLLCMCSMLVPSEFWGPGGTDLPEGPMKQMLARGDNLSEKLKGNSERAKSFRNFSHLFQRAPIGAFFCPEIRAFTGRDFFNRFQSP